jgi:hypothetical protein
MDSATLRKQRLSEWIDRHIGARSLEDFAADISEAGWRIDYSRLGRYRNAKLQVGPKVIGHFNAYAVKHSLPPIDLAERPELLSLEERQLAALERQSKAIEALVGELREWRTVDRAKMEQVQATVDTLVQAGAAAQGSGERGANGAPADSMT